MTDLVHAARTLESEVAALRSSAKMKVAGEPDGFDRNRSVTFDAATTKWLTPILDALGDDRVASVEEVGKQVRITFVPDARADRSHAFGLAEVDEVLNGE